MNGRLRWLDKIIMAALAIVMLAVAGCNHSAYDTFILKKGVGHLSFEYPDDYTVEKVEVRPDYTDITLTGPVLKKERDFTLIGLFVVQSTAQNPEPEASLRRELEIAREWPDFQLLSRSSVTVAGIEGQQIVYSFQMPRPPQDVMRGLEPAPRIIRKLYFTCGTLEWIMTIRSSIATAEADKAIFEHILQTFKILD